MVATNPGTTNLISWWKFDEASGNAVDSHGSNTLAETSGTIDAVAGKVNGGRDLEAGDTEYFEVADNASVSFGDEDFTCGLWIKPETIPGGAHHYFGKWNSGGNKREYVMGIDHAYDWYSPMFFVSSDGTNFHYVISGVNCSAGNWYFVVFWHDSVNNRIGISVNNEAAVTTAHSTGCFDSDSPFRVGADGQTTPGNFADGVVDEGFLYRRLLTADEREWLWNSGNGRTYDDLTVVSAKNYYYQQQQ